MHPIYSSKDTFLVVKDGGVVEKPHSKPYPYVFCCCLGVALWCCMY